jgi:hypothetical protein
MLTIEEEEEGAADSVFVIDFVSTLSIVLLLLLSLIMLVSTFVFAFTLVCVFAFELVFGVVFEPMRAEKGMPVCVALRCRVGGVLSN